METEQDQLEKLRISLYETYLKYINGELEKKDARLIAELATVFYSNLKLEGKKKHGNQSIGNIR